MPRALPILRQPLNLDAIEVASPCPADWNDMVGSDRVRFCASCQKSVFNLSGMTRQEATALVEGAEGRVCVRFFRRPDGTILTEDCPVGLHAALKRARRATRVAAATSVAAVAALLAFVGGSLTRKTCDTLRTVEANLVEPVEPAVEVAGGVRPAPTMGEAPAFIEVKGDVAVPEPRPLMGKVAWQPEAVEGQGSPTPGTQER